MYYKRKHSLHKYNISHRKVDISMVNKDNKKGFTIIEVVLVLAIAGLIFAMVFIESLRKYVDKLDQYDKNSELKVVATSS